MENLEPAAQQTHRGFSIDLMNALAIELKRDVVFETADSFPEMLDRTASGEVDGAIANISITAAREEVMDFTLPVFESGLQIMVSGDGTPAIWQQVFTIEIMTYLAVAVALLFGSGMIMWLFERHIQPYFQRPLREALFPSFWWALNLVVNGGFEERQPRSFPGRVLAVIMVVASLFVVSLFVARITAALTVTALTSNVDGLNDLDSRNAGTVASSTAAGFLEAREIDHTTYDGLAKTLKAFEAGEIDVVVFDGPLLKYYLAKNSEVEAYLVERVFRTEDYGIVLPQGSELREPLNKALLKLMENGQYDALVRRWFGES